MKKRLLSFVLAVTMVAGLMLSALPVMSAADKALKTWNVADELEASLKASQEKELTTPEFGALKLEKMAHKWNAPSYHHYVYQSHTSSFVYGPNGSGDGWNWRNAVEVRNNRGSGEGKNQMGVTSYADYAETGHTYIFTAPVTGKYNFVPAALGGAAEIPESIATASDAAFKYTVLKGTTVLADEVIYAGNSDFSEVKDIDLAVGDTISVSVVSILDGPSGSAGNIVSYNFSIQLTDETVPKIPNPDVKSSTIDVAEVLQSTNVNFGAQTGKFGVTVWDTSGGDTVEGKGVEAFTRMSQAKKNDIGGTNYNNGYNPDGYDMIVDPVSKVMTFATKHYNAEHAIKFAPEFAGDWTVSGTASSAGFYLVDEKGATEAIPAGYFKKTFSLELGDAIWIYQNDTNPTSWNNRSISLTGLTFFGVQTSVHHDAVYEEKLNINVAEELLKSTLSWDTAVQPREQITFSGNPVFAQYIFGTTSSIPVEPGFDEQTAGRVYGDYKWYSADGATGNDSNALYVWKDGSKMRYAVDGGGRYLGYKFTAPSAGEYVFAFSAFDESMEGGSASGCVLKIYDGSGNELATNTSTAFAYEYVKTMAKDEAIYCLVGRTWAGWNNKRKFDFTANIIQRDLISAAYDENVEGWVDDPDYTYQYKRDNIVAEMKDAFVPTKKEFTVDLSLTGFRVPYAGFAVKLNYDNTKLEVVSIEEGAALGANKFAVEPLTTLNPLIIAYVNNANDLDNGVVASVKFKAKSGVTVDSITEITPEIVTIARVNDAGEGENLNRYVTKLDPATLTFFDCEHNSVHYVAAKEEPTCSEYAHIGYYFCDDCQKMFAEETCDTYLSEDDVKTKNALGHDWEYEQVFNKSTGKWEHTATCNNGCGETIEATDCTIAEWKAAAADNKHEGVCSVCKMKATEDCSTTHWTTDVAATWVAGSASGTCDICSRAITKELPAKAVSSATVSTKPTALTYAKNGTFDPKGMKVTINYAGGGSTVITSFTDVEFTYDFSTTGSKTVTFTIAGKNLSVTVTVSAGLPGDANNSGKVDTADATAILKYILKEGTVNTVNADCNGKKGIDTADATAILKYILKEGSLSAPAN